MYHSVYMQSYKNRQKLFNHIVRNNKAWTFRKGWQETVTVADSFSTSVPEAEAGLPQAQAQTGLSEILFQGTEEGQKEVLIESLTH